MYNLENWVIEMNLAFWKNKKVLITGHTGFKGSWLSIWLHSLGAEVIGYALDPYTDKDNFTVCRLQEKMIDIRGDIRNIVQLSEVFNNYKPDIVFHMAAQPLVMQSYKKPKETYEINVMGTLHVLECIRNCDNTKIGIFITSDKCYENKEQIWGYKEDDPFGGYDPYSSSKACTEILIGSYRKSFMNPDNYEVHGKGIASVRSGNVIGGGDWAKDRIIPDCIRSLEKDESIKIRCSNAVRPWQHILEPLSGYMLLAERLYNEPLKYAEGWNFGPNLDSIISVWEIAKLLIKFYGKGSLEEKLELTAPHESKLLSLDISKAKFKLNWSPKMNVEQAVRMTVEWYKNYNNSNGFELCQNQIKKFLQYK